jgi:hypothetical protein
LDTSASSISGNPELAIAFFLGGVIVILVLVGYEMYLRKMEK